MTRTKENRRPELEFSPIGPSEDADFWAPSSIMLAAWGRRRHRDLLLARRSELF
jgi:hypothetical protein